MTEKLHGYFSVQLNDRFNCVLFSFLSIRYQLRRRRARFSGTRSIRRGYRRSGTEWPVGTGPLRHRLHRINLLFLQKNPMTEIKRKSHKMKISFFDRKWISAAKELEQNYSECFCKENRSETIRLRHRIDFPKQKRAIYRLHRCFEERSGVDLRPGHVRTAAGRMRS